MAKVQRLDSQGLTVGRYGWRLIPRMPFKLKSLLLLPEHQRIATLNSLSSTQCKKLLYDWEFWARANQLPPEGDWLIWFLLAGRGFGKTRTGAEHTRRQVETGQAGRIALVANTPADVRDVMIEGESGLIAVSPPNKTPIYEPSKRRLTWPNGAMALAFSSYEPDQLRGPQFDFAWCDELASWKYPRETFDNLMFALRLGNHPRAVVTSTPKPIKLVKELIEQNTTAVTRGSSYENRANLAEAFFSTIIARYEGTRTGQQEIYAEIMEEAEGALWSRDLIELSRTQTPPEFIRVVVAIDPAVTSTEQSDETGIIVAAIDSDRQGYVLKDVSGRYSPDGWAKKALEVFDEFQADRIIAESNNGGEMVSFTLRTVRKSAPITLVHASKGKAARAEPVAALYEQGKIHHVGAFSELEDQLCTWEPNSGDKSPDRLDALVWAFTELIIEAKRRPNVVIV